MGIWPSADWHAIWTDGLWQAICNMDAPPPMIDVLPEIGCDVAREGSDKTDIHLRWGCRSLFHESMSGWTEPAICGRLIELAREYVEKINTLREANRMPPLDYHHVPIKVDDDGTGGAICNFLMAEDMNAQPVRSGKQALFVERYPNKRSELWFTTVAKAMQGLVSLGKLDQETQYMLRRQAMMPLWGQTKDGRREVEPKKKTRDRLNGKSPDGMDALNLAYYEMSWEAPTTLKPQRVDANEAMVRIERGTSYEQLRGPGLRMQSRGIGRRLFRR